MSAQSSIAVALNLLFKVPSDNVDIYFIASWNLIYNRNYEKAWIL